MKSSVNIRPYEITNQCGHDSSPPAKLRVQELIAIRPLRCQRTRSLSGKRCVASSGICTIIPFGRRLNHSNKRGPHIVTVFLYDIVPTQRPRSGRARSRCRTDRLRFHQGLEPVGVEPSPNDRAPLGRWSNFQSTQSTQCNRSRAAWSRRPEVGCPGVRSIPVRTRNAGSRTTDTRDSKSALSIRTIQHLSGIRFFPLSGNLVRRRDPIQFENAFPLKTGEDILYAISPQKKERRQPTRFENVAQVHRQSIPPLVFPVVHQSDGKRPLRRRIWVHDLVIAFAEVCEKSKPA